MWHDFMMKSANGAIDSPTYSVNMDNYWAITRQDVSIILHVVDMDYEWSKKKNIFWWVAEKCMFRSKLANSFSSSFSLSPMLLYCWMGFFHAPQWISKYKSQILPTSGLGQLSHHQGIIQWFTSTRSLFDTTSAASAIIFTICIYVSAVGCMLKLYYY